MYNFQSRNLAFHVSPPKNETFSPSGIERGISPASQAGMLTTILTRSTYSGMTNIKGWKLTLTDRPSNSANVRNGRVKFPKNVCTTRNSITIRVSLEIFPEAKRVNFFWCVIIVFFCSGRQIAKAMGGMANTSSARVRIPSRTNALWLTYK